MTIERRDIGLGEIKFATDSDMSFSGYGAIFGNVDSYGDTIAKGAFKGTLTGHKKAGTMPLMLSQHGGFLSSDMTPVGVWTDMHEDDKGLWVEGKLAPTPRGQELYTLMKMTPRPAIDGLSIGFMTKEFSLRTKPDEPRRTLKAVELLEVSLVSMPANPKARVQNVKSFDAMFFRGIERDLRSDAGLSGSAAVRAVAILKKHLRDGGVDVPEPEARDEQTAAELRSFVERIRALSPVTK
jgi:uncharacterized protein